MTGWIEMGIWCVFLLPSAGARSIAEELFRVMEGRIVGATTLQIESRTTIEALGMEIAMDGRCFLKPPRHLYLELASQGAILPASHRFCDGDTDTRWKDDERAWSGEINEAEMEHLLASAAVVLSPHFPTVMMVPNSPGRTQPGPDVAEEARALAPRQFRHGGTEKIREPRSSN